ncbi:hypothetical protein B0H13DRAFT_1877965 [Mycena leptocephala]|nr:hypothetical protein B0H13DRAFT_1877965 [Mycena leptocephala]
MWGGGSRWRIRATWINVQPSLSHYSPAPPTSTPENAALGEGARVDGAAGKSKSRTKKGEGEGSPPSASSSTRALWRGDGVGCFLARFFSSFPTLGVACRLADGVTRCEPVGSPIVPSFAATMGASKSAAGSRGRGSPSPMKDVWGGDAAGRGSGGEFFVRWVCGEGWFSTTHTEVHREHEAGGEKEESDTDADALATLIFAPARGTLDGHGHGSPSPLSAVFPASLVLANPPSSSPPSSSADSASASAHATQDPLAPSQQGAGAQDDPHAHHVRIVLKAGCRREKEGGDVRLLGGVCV